MQALPAAPESLCIVEMGGHDNTADGGPVSVGGLYLNIGLQVRIHRKKVLKCESELVAERQTVDKSSISHGNVCFKVLFEFKTCKIIVKLNTYNMKFL